MVDGEEVGKVPVCSVLVPPLWESVELAPTGERQSPIYIRWRDSTYDPGLKPLTISYDPTTCLHVWNNGYLFLVEFEDSADKSGERQTGGFCLVLKGQLGVSTDRIILPPWERAPCLLAAAWDSLASFISVLEQFWTLLFTSEGRKKKRMVDNFHPLQPLMNRTVCSSFHHDYVLNIQAKPKPSTSQVIPKWHFALIHANFLKVINWTIPNTCI
ncbi:carbonic anhydrase 5B, mitochondrial [Manis javanica]|uniref:carbonic anhydrase 5B, mitochondrial n=1 Tax=Manis javanica TaxID=9974 RepID=UPI003C6DA240